MPYAPPRHCPAPGHPPFTGQRCPLCAKVADAARLTAAGRGYGGKWRRLRAELMPAGTPCRMCGAPASHLDHIRPKATGGTDDPSNLQPLCARCHSSKTSARDGGFGNRRAKG